ncbi:MAG: type II toxin-antitoxin system HicB family antitoxin [Patescibacteria group bacterium]
MAKLTYHVLVWKEEKWYVARCLELEVASQGKTKKEALANLREAVDLYLEDEDLERFLLPKMVKPQISQIRVS